MMVWATSVRFLMAIRRSRHEVVLHKPGAGRSAACGRSAAYLANDRRFQQLIL